MLTSFTVPSINKSIISVNDEATIIRADGQQPVRDSIGDLGTHGLEDSLTRTYGHHYDEPA